MVKNLHAMQETQVQSLGWEDSVEKEMAPHSSIFPGKSHAQRSLATLCREREMICPREFHKFYQWIEDPVDSWSIQHGCLWLV